MLFYVKVDRNLQGLHPKPFHIIVKNDIKSSYHFLSMTFKNCDSWLRSVSWKESYISIDVKFQAVYYACNTYITMFLVLSAILCALGHTLLAYLTSSARGQSFCRRGKKSCHFCFVLVVRITYIKFSFLVFSKMFQSSSFSFLNWCPCRDYSKWNCQSIINSIYNVRVNILLMRNGLRYCACYFKFKLINKRYMFRNFNLMK